MSNKVDLDALLELEAKATPGPWEAYGEVYSPKGSYLSGVKTLAVVPYHEAVVSPYVSYEDSGCTESEFIAAMRNSIRELCSELKAARKVVEYLRKLDRQSGNYLDGHPPIAVLKEYDKVTGKGDRE